MPKKITIKEFISRAIFVHAGKYDYSSSTYESYHKKLIITCNKHGNFLQKPSHHLAGSGCSKCRDESASKRMSITHDEFINRCKIIHCDRYDYSKTSYISGKHRVTITCAKHGDFTQLADSHINGRGCKKCASELVGNKNRLSIDEFITKAIDAHGERYDYSLSKYKSAKIPVVIICKKHGEFKQSPDSHIRGTGCVKCTTYGAGEAYVYLMEMNGLIKIGVSNNPSLRLSQINRSSPFSVVLIATFLFSSWSEAVKAENKAHKKISDKNAGMSGFDGATEFFNVRPSEAADIIKSLGGKNKPLE